MKQAPDSLKIMMLMALLLASIAGWAATRESVNAQGTGNGNNSEEFIFGSVGITPGQTARLNVVNTATSGRAQTRVLKFLDAAGNVIVDEHGDPVTKTVTLAPGEAAYLDLNGDDIPAGTGRVQIRALDPTCATCRETPRSVIQTLELIDNVTHHTDVLYAPAQFLQPEGPPNSPVPFGMVGIADGQTARLSVTIPTDPMTPGDPMRVLLGFVRADGQPVTNLDGMPRVLEVTLHPGESAYFDLPAHFVLAAGDPRAEIRAVVAPDGPPARLIATLEVLENCSTCTGKTTVLYAPVMRTCGASD